MDGAATVFAIRLGLLGAMVSHSPPGVISCVIPTPVIPNTPRNVNNLSNDVFNVCTKIGNKISVVFMFINIHTVCIYVWHININARIFVQLFLSKSKKIWVYGFILIYRTIWKKNPLTGFQNHWISYHTPPFRLLNIQEIFAPSNEPLTNYHYSDINPDGWYMGKVWKYNRKCT